jgi:hypothetical protein
MVKHRAGIIPLPCAFFILRGALKEQPHPIFSGVRSERTTLPYPIMVCENWAKIIPEDWLKKS